MVATVEHRMENAPADIGPVVVACLPSERALLGAVAVPHDVYLYRTNADYERELKKWREGDAYIYGRPAPRPPETRREWRSVYVQGRGMIDEFVDVYADSGREVYPHRHDPDWDNPAR